jgi:hypothetical protein
MPNLSKETRLRRYREEIEAKLSDLWFLLARLDLSAAKDGPKVQRSPVRL